jgi:glycosyltransferase involved in cell wall biosynthesis
VLLDEKTPHRIMGLEIRQKARDSIRRSSELRILIDYRPALRERTGVGEYVHELTAAAVRSAPPADTITLFSSSWKDRLAPDTIPGARTVDAMIPVRALNFAWHRLGWPPVERLARGAFDVVYAGHPLPIPAKEAARVVTVHDLDFLDHPERTRREIRRDYATLIRRGLDAADHIIANSANTAAQIERRLHVDAAKITICLPGAPPWPRRLDEPEAGYVLFFGTLEPRKNVGALLDAYEHLVADAANGLERLPRLVLAGGIPAEASRLVARIRQSRLARNVELLGYVEAERRPDIYRGAMALVMPSHHEGFGMPALEAMATGVPVIAAERGALPETVGLAGYLFNPDEPASLPAALRTVLNDRALRDRMRELGWARARELQWSDTAAGARRAWAKAVEHRNRRRG